MSFFASGKLYVCISVWALIYSLSIPAYAIQGDLNGDDSVNHIDLYEFVLQWLGDAGGNANLDGDDDVDFADFALLATNWLEDTESVIINEFMAINDDTLLDGNGESSDWIELYNTGMQDINLSGWRLTDDADELTKWMFPDITILSHGYLVVFASGRDDAEYPYMDVDGYYHTNFKLSGDGEYLALVKPDGTIAHQYNNYELDDGSLGFPPQSADISYGNASTISSSVVLLDEEADKNVLIPTSDIGTSWTGGAEPFDDSLWDDYTFVSGSSGGVGYDTATTYDNYISYDVEARMSTESTSCYLRIPFDIVTPDDYVGLTLKVRYDDGFVAYLNGIEIASANKPDPLLYNSAAAAQHDDAAAVVFSESDISSYVTQLQAGDNVLAFHGLNRLTTSSDFLISAEVTARKVVESTASTPMYFETPTPGTANADAFVEYVDAPTISQDHGFYSGSFDVGISCDDEDAIIRYTTDGSDPSMTNGEIYTGWMTIDHTTCLRAIAYKAEPGWLPSNIKTVTYLFLDDVIAQGATPPAGWPTSSINGQVFDYGMDSKVLTDSRYADLIDDALLDIPSLSLVTDFANLFDSSSGIYVNAMQDGSLWERPVSVELLNPDGTEGFQIDGGIRIRGGMSRMDANPKHSFRLYFRSEYGESKLNYPLFGDEGVDQFDKIDLRTGQNFSWHLGNSSDLGNSTWLYDVFSRDAAGQMGQAYTRSRYYHLYINGLYWGLYQSEERPEARYAASYYGGDKEDYDAIKSGDDQGVIEATDGVLDSYYQLWTEVNNGMTDNEDYFRIQGLDVDGTVNPAYADDDSYTRLLDVDNLIDYMVTVFYSGNRDSPLGPPHGSSIPRNLMGFYNRVTPDGFKFVAHDGEHTLGVHLSAGVNYDHIDFVTPLKSGLDAQANCNPWWLHISLMDDNDEYRIRFADRVYEHFFYDGVLTPDAATALLENREEEMSMAIIGESARWGDYVTRSYAMVKADWEDIVGRIKDDYINASPSTRTEVVLSQIDNAGWYPSVEAPSFTHGGVVADNYLLTMTAAMGTIYYTTDGSDPRKIGGDVNPDADIYTSAVTLTESCVVKARARYNSEWSPLHEARFAIGPVVENLRITEIMYNPADTNCEFIELTNIGAETLNLAMVQFTNGIEFTFGDMTLAPDAYVLVVQDESEFASKYGSSLNVAGAYTGRLDNAGEQIVLQDILGNVIQSFEYEDGWRSITDGQGYSLTIINPRNPDANTWSEKDGWRPSVFLYGSPGTDDSAEAHNPGDVVINEVLAYSDSYPNDWIELYNTTEDSIDISGWFLSNTGATELDLMNYQIPDGTIIPSDDYVVFTQDDHFGACFTLSENGGCVYLSSEVDTGGHLTGFREQEDFGASESNVSFGRHLKSTGTYNFVAMSSSTYELPNAPPKVGPIVISEIMYHPDWLNGSNYNNNEFEYIELYNTSLDEDVTLFDASTNTPWKFTQGIDYTFSTDSPVTIPAGECIVIVKNPDAFSVRHPAVSSSIIYGPYDGKLQNSGEKLEIAMPGDLDAEGERCYIRIDRVNYSDGSDVLDDWPAAADGLGDSLIRVNVDEYGNDPINWQAAAPTPGTI